MEMSRKYFRRIAKHLTIVAIGIAGLAIFASHLAERLHSDQNAVRSLAGAGPGLNEMRPIRSSRKPIVDSRAEGADVLARITSIKHSGYDFLNRQQEFLKGFDDPQEREHIQHRLTEANRLWLAATLKQMAIDEDYVNMLVKVINSDGGFRVFLIDSFSEMIPALAQHLKRGDKVQAATLRDLFPKDVDYIELFEADVAPELPIELLDGFDEELPKAIAGDLHHCHEVYKGTIDPGEAPYVWGHKYDPIQ